MSDLAEELGIQPSQIHLWVKRLLDQAERAYSFSSRQNAAVGSEKAHMAALQAALYRKDAMLPELFAQFTRRLLPVSRREG